jgi:heme-degrading monooxygenase HmoA
MVITITSIKLRSLWKFFALSFYALQIVRQAKTQKGFLKLRSTGFGYLHYTLTSWETEEDLRAFARSGAHLQSMKKSSALSTEIRTCTYNPGNDSLPTWREARTILNEKGKVLRF